MNSRRLTGGQAFRGCSGNASSQEAYRGSPEKPAAVMPLLPKIPFNKPSFLKTMPFSMNPPKAPQNPTKTPGLRKVLCAWGCGGVWGGSGVSLSFCLLSVYVCLSAHVSVRVSGCAEGYSGLHSSPCASCEKPAGAGSAVRLYCKGSLDA